MRRLGLDDKQLTPRTVLSRISWAKNHMLDPQEVYLQSADPQDRARRAHLRGVPQGAAQSERAGFRRPAAGSRAPAEVCPREVREYYKRRFQYMLVDEYQDTNRPQYELMRTAGGNAPQRLRRRR